MFEYLERDLKQYMDDCGGILSMNNVKVRMLSGVLCYITRTLLGLVLQYQNISIILSDLSVSIDTRIRLLPFPADPS